MVSPRNYHFSWCYSLSYREGNPGWSSRLHPGVFRVAPPQPNVPNRCQKPRLGMQLGLTEGLVSFGDVVPLVWFLWGMRPPLWRFEKSDLFIWSKFHGDLTRPIGLQKVASQPTPPTYPNQANMRQSPFQDGWATYSMLVICWRDLPHWDSSNMPQV